MKAEVRERRKEMREERKGPWSRQQDRRVHRLMGYVVLYDPRGEIVGGAPKRRIYGVVIGPSGYSATCGPLIRIGYGERRAVGEGPNREWIYARTAEVPLGACKEVRYHGV